MASASSVLVSVYFIEYKVGKDHKDRLVRPFLLVCLGFLVTKQKLFLINKDKGNFSVVITFTIKPLLYLQ